MNFLFPLLVKYGWKIGAVAVAAVFAGVLGFKAGLRWDAGKVERAETRAGKQEERAAKVERDYNAHTPV